MIRFGVYYYKKEGNFGKIGVAVDIFDMDLRNYFLSGGWYFSFVACTFADINILSLHRLGYKPYYFRFDYYFENLFIAFRQLN